MKKNVKTWKLENLINDYLNNNCDYEFLEDYIIEYWKINKISINLDYVKNRLYDIYHIKWIVWISTIDILLKDLLKYLKAI